MNSLTLKRISCQLLKQSCSNHRNRIVTLGVLANLTYLPRWVWAISENLLEGSSSIVINLGLLCLGLHALWQNRQTISKLSAPEEDRFVGCFVILGSMALLPLGFSSSSLHSLLSAIIIAGIILSVWGWPFFKRYWFPAALFLASIYPNLRYLASATWRALTPPYLLEDGMAWAGGLALHAIGQPVEVVGRFISIPLRGAVEVASGCNGFDMAFTLAGTGFMVGIFWGLSRNKIITLALVGIAISLVLNVPRIMLLVFAAVYWGKESFEFWHGIWGGQIFAGILFTIYYYVVMWITDQKSRPA